MQNEQTVAWDKPHRPTKVITIRFDRNIVLTLLVSILLHLALLWLFAPKLFSIGSPQPDAPSTLNISLGPPQKKETKPSEQVLPDRRPLPKAPVKARPKKLKNPESIKKQKKRPIAVTKKTEKKTVKRETLNTKKPRPAPQPTPVQPLPGEDMQAYIKRQQEAKLAAQGLSEKDVEEVLASNNPQSAGEKRDAKIKANLDLDGTNGIFQIRALGRDTAQFSFKGWKNNINTARLEIIDVLAPNGVPVRLAVIRRMIEIIRREYDGDFNWDSHRLGRVIQLSARPEDTAALEGFMMEEFFGLGSQFR